MKELLRAAARAAAQVRVQLGHAQGFVGWGGRGVIVIVACFVCFCVSVYLKEGCGS